MFTKQQQSAYAHIVARAWTDHAFRDQLIANPREVLTEHGFEVPGVVDVTVKPESREGKLEFGLPAKPAGISDEDLTKLADVSLFGTF